MKKLLLILLVVYGCSTPEQPQEMPINCNCGTVIESQSFNVLGQNQFSVIKVKNNCTGIIKQIQKNGVISVGTNLCNY